MNCIAVVTTIGSIVEAQSLARALVERKLAACAQISVIESFYTWNDEVQNDKEYRVLFKTVNQRYTEIEDAIRELHSYDLPAIHAFAFEQVYAAYGEWIEANAA
ncbi:MAG: divalent-cation tolerance protein CutA [Woeseia sp.]